MSAYVHFGGQYAPGRFDPVRNRAFSNKPFGGLWASPEGSPFGWREWNKKTGLRKCDEKDSFRFTLSSDARVFRVWSAEDAERMPGRTDFEDEHGMRVTYPILPDFEVMANDYDAIDFRISKDGRLYRMLYTWDCDSILVLNKDVIRVLKGGQNGKR